MTFETAVVLGQQIAIFLLIYLHHRARVDATRSIDRLLLLGKSQTPGEAIAAYERLNRIERARDEILEQRKRPAPGEVAPKPETGAKWFGFRRKRPPTGS